MTYWPKYDIREDSGRSRIALFKYGFERKSGIKGYLKYWVCRYIHGECDFPSSSSTHPTYFRSRVCRRCGSQWFYFRMLDPPPCRDRATLKLKTRYECPSCLDFTDHLHTEGLVECEACGFKFHLSQSKFRENRR